MFLAQATLFEKRNLVLSCSNPLLYYSKAMFLSPVSQSISKLKYFEEGVGSHEKFERNTSCMIYKQCN